MLYLTHGIVYQVALRFPSKLSSSVRYRALLLRGTIIIRTCDQHKTLYIPVFLLTIFGPDYYTPVNRARRGAKKRNRNGNVFARPNGARENAETAISGRGRGPATKETQVYQYSGGGGGWCTGVPLWQRNTE